MFEQRQSRPHGIGIRRNAIPSQHGGHELTDGAWLFGAFRANAVVARSIH